jgi:hypothetical protein
MGKDLKYYRPFDAHAISGPLYFLLSSLFAHASYSDALGRIYLPLPLLSNSRLAPVGTSKGRSQCRVSAFFDSKRSADQHLFGGFDSNISGRFFIFDPYSVLGQVLMRNFRPIRFLNPGIGSALRRKYQSTCSLAKVYENIIRDAPHTVFAAAGQDAAVVVILIYPVYLIRGMQTKNNGHADHRAASAEGSLVPCRCCSYQGKSALDWNRLLQRRSVGDHNLSCQISQARGYIHRIAYFWDKHRGFRRRRVEEVPKNRRASILRGRS